MNKIIKQPLNRLGYDFISEEYLPAGKDEYYLRNEQNGNHASYRRLTAREEETLILNANRCSNWNNVLVSEKFDANLIKNSNFFGLVRIGNLEPLSLTFHDRQMAVGIYNSTIISCDFGDNVCIDHANYLSHYILGNEVMVANVDEFATTSYAKFGFGILKEGEDEKTRVWLEVRNENGGRPIIPFNNMLAGDAWLWSNFPEDQLLQERLKAITEQESDNNHGHYGRIGDRTVIKDCHIIKDVNVGTDAYLKGANKLKNLTINSDDQRTTQIGEGCEMVNGVVGFGCRIFYGVKAVRFVMAAHSQLKYGARLINSYLGNNSTISCCEVLNSLIFPGHEQHHNNSFLCASLIQGQSNIAAGATIGSNHNSRAADGEIIAGRGFWPGLCVSLKHNSKFASFTIIAKGDFPAELNVPIPFSLLSNDTAADKLIIMPGYWFMYNLYALARNTWKLEDRDKRIVKTQTLEYNFLAPDTINEMFDAIKLLSAIPVDKNGSGILKDIENSKRITEVIKVKNSIVLYKELIAYYAVIELYNYYKNNNFATFEEFRKSIPVKVSRSKWDNVGGQLIPRSTVRELIKNIKTEKINSWKSIHHFYEDEGEKYAVKKLTHAFTSLLEIENITTKQFNAEIFKKHLEKAITTKTWLSKGIYESRAKDYSNPYRKMVYENQLEMDAVIGKIEENQFIQQQYAELDQFKKEVARLINHLQ